MNRRLLLTVPAVFVLGTVASAQHDLPIPRQEAAHIRSVLQGAEKLELFRLHGGEPDGPLPEDVRRAEFHEYPILESVDVTTAPERSRLVSEISKSIARSPLRMIACFFPRHGIRAHLADGNQVDLLICFECATLYKLHAGKKVRLNIDEKPAELLNSLLRAAGTRPTAAGSPPTG